MSTRLPTRRQLPIWHAAAFAAVVLIALGAGTSAHAQAEVDLHLALAVDASGSVNQYRFELQKRGYVDALRNPKILAAILGGQSRSITISMVQWTGPFLHVPVLPWTVNDPEVIERLMRAPAVRGVITDRPRLAVETRRRLRLDGMRR